MFAHRTLLICIYYEHELPAKICVLSVFKERGNKICKYAGYLNSTAELNCAPPVSFYLQVLDALFEVDVPLCAILANT